MSENTPPTDRLDQRLLAAFDRLLDAETTTAELADLPSALVETTGKSLGIEELCHVDDSDHVAVVDGEDHAFQCPVDALVVAAASTPPAQVRTVSPDGVPMEVDFADEGVAGPEGAVVSFGVATDADPDDPLTPTDLYPVVCPYVRLFPDAAAYQSWAQTQDDAVTDAVPLAAGVQFARQLATAMTDAGAACDPGCC